MSPLANAFLTRNFLVPRPPAHLLLQLRASFPKCTFFLPSKHMAGREDWKWAVPALERCFFRCSRITYSNCSRCLALGERGRREEPPPCAGLPSAPRAQGSPRALSAPSAATVLPARSSSPPRRARPGQPGLGVPGPADPGMRERRGSPGQGGGSTRLPGPAALPPCLPEAPYGPRCTSAALFPQQLGPEGELQEQRPSPAPQPPGAPALGITRGLRG